MHNARGFTLIELMVAIAIIGILTAIAIPAYNGYITSSRQSVATSNLQTLRLAEEAYYFDHNSYAEGDYIPADHTDTLSGPLGWKPDQDGNQYVYAVDPGACGDIKKCYKMTVKYGGAVLATEER